MSKILENIFELVSDVVVDRPERIPNNTPSKDNINNGSSQTQSLGSMLDDLKARQSTHTNDDASHESSSDLAQILRQRYKKRGILISYDSKGCFELKRVVCKVVEDLKSLGFQDDVWFDKDEGETTTNASFVQRLESSESCNAAILFISHQYFHSTLSSYEVEIFRQRNSEITSSGIPFRVFVVKYSPSDIPVPAEFLNTDVDLTSRRLCRVSAAEKASAVVGALCVKLEGYSFFFNFFHFILFQLISFRFISFHLISFTSFHFISFHFSQHFFPFIHFTQFNPVSFHLVSFHLISPIFLFHFISSYFISFRFISFWFYFIPFQFINFISFHLISFHFISSHSISHINFGTGFLIFFRYVTFSTKLYRELYSEPGDGFEHRGYKNKPVFTWNVGDVQDWLGSLGIHERYRVSFEESEIDGYLLKCLKECDMLEHLNVDSKTARQKIFYTLTNIQVRETSWDKCCQNRRMRDDIVYLVCDPVDMWIAEFIKSDLVKVGLTVNIS